MAGEDLLRWMDENRVLCGITALCLAAVPVYLLLSRKRNLPPGPRAWPLIGSYPLMAKMGAGTKMGEFLNWLHEKYGPVSLIYFGVYPIVIVSGFETIRDAFKLQSDATNDRPVFIPGFKDMDMGEGVNSASNLTIWKRYKKTMIHEINSMRADKSYHEQFMQEVKEVLESFRNTGEGPFDPLTVLTDLFTRTRICMLLGKRVNEGDDLYKKMRRFVTFLTDKSGPFSPAGTVPLIRYIPGLNKGYREFMEWMRVSKHEFRREINDRRDIFDPNDVHSAVDVFLKAQTEEPSSKISDEGIAVCCQEQIIAGIPGLAGTIDWCLHFLAKCTDIQDKCHAEIYKEIGKFRQPGFEDLKKLPYVQAIVYETLRYVGPVWTSVPHAASTDMKLGGYNIPKDAILMGNLWSANHDVAEWTEPSKFNPDRFLKSDGTMDDLPRAFIPHGIGPRQCPGVWLAVAEMSVLLASLVQKYRYAKDLNKTTESVFRKLGTIPKPNSIIAKPR